MYRTGKQNGDKKQKQMNIKKLRIKSPYDPAIPLLGLYHEETKIERDTGIHCSLQQYLQQLENGTNLDVHPQMNG